MKVSIDYSRCMGDGRCSEVCPEVFEYDEDQTEVRIRISPVPDRLRDQVRQAAEECDTDAINIED